MTDRLIAFSLLAHGLQAAILFLDTRGWREGLAGPALRRWLLDRRWARRRGDARDGRAGRHQPQL